MDDHETSAGDMTQQSAVVAIISAAWFRLSVLLITMVLLLWTAWGGFKLARDSDSYTDWVFSFGILTMLFSFLFVILGLPIAAEFFFNLNLNLSELLEEAVGTQKGLNMMKDQGAGETETETITQVTARILGTLVTMAMLCWTIYTGFKLTTEPKHSKYYILTTSIGALAIIFGVVYFIIIAALGLYLPSLYQKAKHSKNHHHLSGLKI